MFINEELIEIIIEKMAAGYAYSFKINDEVDTPINRAKKKTAKKNLWYGVLFLTMVVALSILAAVVSEKHKEERRRRQKEKIEQLLKKYGKDGKISKEEKRKILKELYHNWLFLHFENPELFRWFFIQLISTKIR